MPVYTTKSSGIPAGQYRLKFSSYEQSTHAEYGDRIRWEFEVVHGPQRGQTTSAFTGARLTRKSKFMELIVQAFLGRQLEVDEEFNPDPHIGREFLGIVVPTDNGSTKLNTLIAADGFGDSPASPAAPPPPAPDSEQVGSEPADNDGGVPF